jgi:hypothetical protein
MTENQPEDAGTIEENLPVVTFIQMTRLYDVAMAILQEMSPEKATVLHELHARGDFISPAPALAPEE